MRVEPEMDSFRYVEAPRRHVQPPPPERKMITEKEDDRIHIDITERRRERDYDYDEYDRGSRAYDYGYDRGYRR